MLKIKYKKENNIIKYVIFEGHAKYDVQGKDIVCASASSIYITSVNAILSFDKNAITYSNDGVCKVVNLKKDKITNEILNNMINMFGELEAEYKKNIKLMEE